MPISVSVNPSTNMVYVANYEYNTVSVIDGKTNAVTGNITVGRFPESISVNPSTNMVYVANSGDGTVSVINGTQTIIGLASNQTSTRTQPTTIPQPTNLSTTAGVNPAVLQMLITQQQENQNKNLSKMLAQIENFASKLEEASANLQYEE